MTTDDTEDPPQQRRIAAYKANGWELSHFMEHVGIAVMRKMDVSPNGRETPLKAHIDGGGSSRIV